MKLNSEGRATPALLLLMMMMEATSDEEPLNDMRLNGDDEKEL
jgi:hypothetical protein